MPEIILIRGVPGSGKSTIAEGDYPNHVNCEADQFFQKNGRYQHNSKKIKEAHKWCQDKALDALKNGSNVVVSNTFIKLWEMEPYLDMGFPVKVVEAKGAFDNVHGVPVEIVERMKKQYEKYDGE